MPLAAELLNTAVWITNELHRFRVSFCRSFASVPRLQVTLESIELFKILNCFLFCSFALKLLSCHIRLFVLLFTFQHLMLKSMCPRFYSSCFSLLTDIFFLFLARLSYSIRFLCKKKPPGFLSALSRLIGGHLTSNIKHTELSSFRFH